MDFLCGLRLNRLIKKVSSPIYDATVTLTSKNIFDMLIPFFVSNEAFESLHVHYDVDVGGLSSAPGQLNSLKEIELAHSKNANQEQAREIIEALVGHSGLRGFIFMHLSRDYILEGRGGRHWRLY